MTLRLTIHDCRKAGYCVAGIRRLCEAHGQDFRAFVRQGIPIAEIIHIDDAALKRCIEVARKERGNGQGG